MDNVVALHDRHGIPAVIRALVAEYLGHLDARGYATNSLLAYGRDLERWAAWLERHDITLLPVVGERQIDDWLDEQLRHTGVTRRTAARRLATLRGFYRWALRRGYVTHDATREIRIGYQTEVVRAPDAEVLEDVIAAVPTDHWLGLRDRAFRPRPSTFNA